MNLDELNFDLPPELIAQRPLAKRDDSRMMLLDRISGKWEDRQFREFPELLRGDELVVFNNARVIPARLFGKRIGIRATESGAHNPAKQEHLQADIEVLLVRQLDENRWETLVRPGRKVPVGERIIFGDGELEGVVQGREEFGLRVIRFVSKSGFHEALVRLGHIPLPPYIKREDEPADRDRYQTVYAKQGSAVAARTKNRNCRDYAGCGSRHVRAGAYREAGRPQDPRRELRSLQASGGSDRASASCELSYPRDRDDRCSRAGGRRGKSAG